jgi:hypothetical protein
MRSVLALLAIAFVFSCSKKEDPCCTIIDTSIMLTVKDTEGNDLLNPLTPGSFTEQGIYLYYVTNGVAERVNYGNLDHPKMFRIIDEYSDAYRIIIYPNTAISEAFPLTYIQWTDNDTDTIRCELFRDSNREIVTKVWFNEQERWSDEDGTERFLQIVKQGISKGI